MAERAAVSRRTRLAAGFLMVCGGIGIVTGAVPFVVCLVRLFGFDLGVDPEDWAAHGVEAMGLTNEWAALSSAEGAFLGGLLVAAGLGWRRGRPWAPLVTLIYGTNGILVCGTDLVIFVRSATPGRVRTLMLILDGAAFALALCVLFGLIIWWRRWPAKGAEERERGSGQPAE